MKLPIMQLPPVTSSITNVNTALNTMFSNTSTYVVPLIWDANFHTDSKQEIKLALYILLFTFLDRCVDKII
jgi:hypothetical protein